MTGSKKEKAASVPNTLFGKSLVLISVPLLFETIFIVILFFVLRAADSDYAALLRSKDILMGAARVSEDIYAAGEELLKLRLIRSDEGGIAFHNRQQNFHDEIEKLCAALSRRPDTREQAIRLQIITRKIDSCIGEHLSGSNFAIPSIWKRQDDIAMSKEFRTLVTVLLAYLSDVIAKETKTTQLEPEIQNRTHTHIILALLAGFALNALVAVWLAMAFNRDTIRRLAILVENTSRLACKAELLPEIPGNDEIAKLDNTFREMAYTISLSEQQLQASEMRQRKFLENMPVGLLSLTSDYKVDYANPRIEQMLSRAHRDLISCYLADLFEHDLGGDPLMASEQMVMRASQQTQEYRAIKSNGEKLPVRLVISHHDVSEHSRFLANITDVSREKELEELKQKFVAMISHDIRIPLTAVQGFLELMSMGAYGTLSDTAVSRLSTAKKSISRLIDLLGDLLQLEKLQAGAFRLEKIETSMAELLNESIESVRELALSKGLKIMANISDEYVSVDKRRVLQVLINILSNAIKHSTHDSSVVVDTNKSAGWYEIAIRDSGPGIPAASQQRIFERFYQVDPKRTEESSGTGLGLAICKEIVEQHHGEIGVDSVPGEYSRFWVRFPVEPTAKS
jgi:PAS domain S-box-containing protein